MSETASTEANPPEETLKPAILVGWGLINQLWCVRDGVSDNEVLSAANTNEPLGSVGNGSWNINDDEAVSEHIQRCPDYPNRHHLVVNC